MPGYWQDELLCPLLTSDPRLTSSRTKQSVTLFKKVKEKAEMALRFAKLEKHYDCNYD
jgi:hypothetical protein